MSRRDLELLYEEIFRNPVWDAIDKLNEIKDQMFKDNLLGYYTTDNGLTVLLRREQELQPSIEVLRDKMHHIYVPVAYKFLSKNFE